MLNFELILLQAQGGSGSAAMLNFVFIGAMILVFWLFLIRPQSKKQKEQRSFVDNMEKGDDVVTTSGILGRINKIEDEIVCASHVANLARFFSCKSTQNDVMCASREQE